MGMDRLEVLPTILCPECGSILLVIRNRAICKLPKGKHCTDDVKHELIYIVDCGNTLCGDYRKVKFLKAQYIEVEFKWVD